MSTVADSSEQVTSCDGANTAAGKRKRGKPVHTCWAHLSDEPNIHQLSKPNNVTCKHCKENVRHHHKTLSVIGHLRKCRPFTNLMKNLKTHERPKWFTKKQKTTTLTAAFFTPASTTTKPKLQKKIDQFGLPKLSKKQLGIVHQRLAMHYYTTGTAFSRIENKYLLQAFELCRPEIKLPSRHDLSSPLLDLCYDQVKRVVDGTFKSNNQPVCVTSDGWSNVLNDPIVNYTATTEDLSLFIESVATGDVRHDAEWIASDLTRVIQSIGPFVCGAITDNTRANKNAWHQLQKEFPSLFFHGCASHGLHLLVKDIFGAKKTRVDDSGKNQYPAEYPFEYLLQFTTQCRKIVKFFSSHHVPKANLKQAQDVAGKRRLQLPAPTRWGSLQNCLKSVNDSDSILTGIVGERGFVCESGKKKKLREKIKGYLTDANFVANMTKSLALLKPIDEYITAFQSDAVPVSEVYQAFQKLPCRFRQISTLSGVELQFLDEIISTRYKLIEGVAHSIGNILDPRFLGDGMDRLTRQNTETLLRKFPDYNGETSVERQEKLLCQYSAFRIEALKQRRLNDVDFTVLGQKGEGGKVKKSILKYWQSDCTDWPELQDIAVRVFSMAASSAASERNFSTFGFVHSKLRNRLSPERVRKLVFIKTNEQQLRGKLGFNDETVLLNEEDGMDEDVGIDIIDIYDTDDDGSDASNVDDGV